LGQQLANAGVAGGAAGNPADDHRVFPAGPAGGENPAATARAGPAAGGGAATAGRRRAGGQATATQTSAKPKPVVKPLPKPVAKPAGQAPVPAPVPQPVAAPAPAPPAPPAPAPITPASANAGYLHNPAPEYPPLAMRRNWEGTVLLRVHVLASGKPGEIQIQKSSGREQLDDAALAAVKRWSFVPAKQGNDPTDGWVSVPIDFKLK